MIHAVAELVPVVPLRNTSFALIFVVCAHLQGLAIKAQSLLKKRCAIEYVPDGLYLR